MSPNLSGWNRASRLFIGTTILPAGAALWPGASDLFVLLGVTTFMTGVVGWCPLHERVCAAIHTHRNSESEDRRRQSAIRQ